jgi:CRP-like cAMP-binding protein
LYRRTGGPELIEAATAHILDLDPDLGATLDAAEFEAARGRLLARSYGLEPGPWAIPQVLDTRGAYGLLIVDGLVGLRTALAERATLELLGAGDLLQPWVQLGLETQTTVPPTARWEVLQRSRILLLDRDFARAAAAWPEIAGALLYRQVWRSRRLCYQLAVNAAPHIDQRLLYSLWALADRWGRVTEAGTLLELRLTHQQLAELVAARRPSVSAALKRLQDAGRIRYSRTRFLLRGDVPGEVEALRRQLT